MDKLDIKNELESIFQANAIKIISVAITKYCDGWTNEEAADYIFAAIQKMESERGYTYNRCLIALTMIFQPHLKSIRQPAPLIIFEDAEI